MANAYSFRSAFNGFNREDVVHYIEYVNSNHNNQLNQLRAELAAAQQGRASGQDEEQLSERYAELESRYAELQAQLAVVTAERDEAISTAARPREEAVPQTPVMKLSSYIEDELAAYRRAERVERETRERVAALERDTHEKTERLEQEAKRRTDAIYAQIQQMLSDALAKADDAAAQLDGLSDRLSSWIVFKR